MSLTFIYIYMVSVRDSQGKRNCSWYFKHRDLIEGIGYLQNSWENEGCESEGKPLPAFRFTTAGVAPLLKELLLLSGSGNCQKPPLMITVILWQVRGFLETFANHHFCQSLNTNLASKSLVLNFKQVLLVD